MTGLGAQETTQLSNSANRDVSLILEFKLKTVCAPEVQNKPRNKKLKLPYNQIGWNKKGYSTVEYTARVDRKMRTVAAGKIFPHMGNASTLVWKKKTDA